MQNKGLCRRVLRGVWGYGLLLAAVFLGARWWALSIPLAILGGWVLENLGRIDGEQE